jgi:hypothetical protein
MNFKKIITICASLVILIVLTMLTGVTRISYSQTKITPLLDPFVQSEEIFSDFKPKIDTKNWQFYSNPFHTFSIQFPENWNSQEQKYFSDNEIDLLGADVLLTKNLDNPTHAQITIHDYNQKCNDQIKVGYGDIKTTEVTLNNANAQKIEGNNNNQFTNDQSFMTLYLLQNHATCIEVSVWQLKDNSEMNEISTILETLVTQ